MTDCSCTFEFRKEIGQQIHALPAGTLRVHRRLQYRTDEIVRYEKKGWFGKKPVYKQGFVDVYAIVSFSPQALKETISDYVDLLVDGVPAQDFKTQAELFVWIQKNYKGDAFYPQKSDYVDADGKPFPEDVHFIGREQTLTLGVPFSAHSVV